MSDLTTLQSFLEQQALLHGPDIMDPLMQYALFRKADTPLLSTDFFTTTYGAKVWSVLNDEARFFNLLRKVPWGNTTGWRNRSARTGSTAGIAEAGTLPDFKKSTFTAIYSEPRSVVTPFSVTAKAQFMGRLEGGIGDALATEQEGGKNDHVKWINQAVLSGAHGVCTTAGASGVAVVAPYGIFKPGDRFYGTGAGGADHYTVTTHNETTGVVTFTADGAGGNLVDGNEYVVKSRRGPTSLDDIVEVDGRTMAGINADDVDCYNLSTRAANSYAAASVLDNDGVARNITTGLLDEAIRNVRQKGGEPDLILTGLDQIDNISSLLAAKQRFMEAGEFKVKMGSETTLPGTKTGFQVVTYKGIPVFHDVDIPISYAEDGTNHGSKVFVLDTRYLEIAVGTMTQYLESRDYIANNMLAVKALFWTMFELRCTDITKQAKIEDLTAVLS